MAKYIKDISLAEGLLIMLERFFGIYVPTSIVVLVVTILVAEKARNYVLRKYPKESFTYRHFGVRLLPTTIAIVAGISISRLFRYFEVPGWAKFSVMMAMLSVALWLWEK